MVSRLEQLHLREAVLFDEGGFAFRFEVARQEVIVLTVVEKQADRIVVFFPLRMARIFLIIFLVENGHAHPFAEFVGLLCAVRLLGALEGGVMRGARRHLFVACGNVIVVDRARRVCPREVDDGSACELLEDAVASLGVRKARDVVLVRVRRDHEFQRAVGAVIPDVVADVVRAVLPGARVDQDVDVARLYVGTVTRVVVAEFQKVEGKILVAVGRRLRRSGSAASAQGRVIALHARGRGFGIDQPVHRVVDFVHLKV